MLYCSFYKHYIDLKLYDSFGVVNNVCIACVLMRNIVERCYKILIDSNSFIGTNSSTGYGYSPFT